MNRDGEPDVVQCVQCHQSGPFIHDPFMDSARDPDDPGRPVMPEITGRDVPYYVVGGSGWDMRTIRIEGNRCLGCHSAPMEISQIFEASTTRGEQLHAPARAQAAWPTTTRSSSTAGSRDRRTRRAATGWFRRRRGVRAGVVGDDYPHKSDYFNQPGGKSAATTEGKD